MTETDTQLIPEPAPPQNPAVAKYIMTTETSLPHMCAGCGLQSDGRTLFCDFGLSFDYEGAIQFCVNCCKEIATAVGYYSPDAISAIREAFELADTTNQDLAEKLKAADEHNSALSDELDSFRRLGISVANIDSLVETLETSQRIIAEAARGSESGLIGSGELPPKPVSRSTKPVTKF